MLNLLKLNLQLFAEGGDGGAAAAGDGMGGTPADATPEIEAKKPAQILYGK